MTLFQKILHRTQAFIWGGVCCLWLPGGALADGPASLSVPATVSVPAGVAIVGSDRREREMAYRLDEQAYGHSITRTRRWYEDEKPRMQVRHSGYRIMENLVTQHAYHRFVTATGHRSPDVSARVWAGYGLIHPYRRTARYRWRGGMPAQAVRDHPIVLVSHGDAVAYARWLTEKTGVRWRLPTEQEWEIAARGRDGRYFPWGPEFDAARLNSHDRGPFATVGIGLFPSGVSPFGMMDAAGQVFEWTATPAGKNRFVVKGGSWDDSGCGICRPAARHGRPENLKHILIGFRLVRETEIVQ